MSSVDPFVTLGRTWAHFRGRKAGWVFRQMEEPSLKSLAERVAANIEMVRPGVGALTQDVVLPLQ